MKNFRSAKTLVCMIIPTKKFEFFKEYKKQGNYYQYELVKKYTLVTKVLWHSLRNQMVLEKDIMDKLRTNAMSFAYVNYLHSDDLGEQW